MRDDPLSLWVARHPLWFIAATAGAIGLLAIGMKLITGV